MISSLNAVYFFSRLRFEGNPPRSPQKVQVWESHVSARAYALPQMVRRDPHTRSIIQDAEAVKRRELAIESQPTPKRPLDNELTALLASCSPSKCIRSRNYSRRSSWGAHRLPLTRLSNETMRDSSTSLSTFTRNKPELGEFFLSGLWPYFGLPLRSDAESDRK